MNKPLNTPLDDRDFLDNWRCTKCGSLSECCFCEDEEPKSMGDFLREALEEKRYGFSID